MAKRCDLTGVGVMTGNNVSKSRRRTKRDFLPNLKEVVFKSDVLGANVTLKVTTNTLRTINKYGNLDAFLINYGHNKLTEEAKKLKRKVEKALIAKGEYNNVKIIDKSKKPKVEKKRIAKIKAQKANPKPEAEKKVKAAPKAKVASKAKATKTKSKTKKAE